MGCVVELPDDLLCLVNTWIAIGMVLFAYLCTSLIGSFLV